MNARITGIVWATLLLAGLLSACTMTPTPSQSPVSPPPTTGNVLRGLAAVKHVDLMQLESFPVQVHARIQGELSDSCTQLGPITQTRAGGTITVVVPTVRPADAVCTTIVGEFDQTVPLEVNGLPAGEYIVDVNGVRATFTLTRDNRLP